MHPTMNRSTCCNWAILLFVLTGTTSLSNGGDGRSLALPGAGSATGAHAVPADSSTAMESGFAASADDESDASEVPTEEAIPPVSFALVIEPATLDPGTLRAYDIRGVFEETVTPGHAVAIGRSFATLVRARTGGAAICVGYDGRLSSPTLEDALVQGLIASGASVTRIGLGPTPMLYFAGKTGNADGAIMITGSHNPPNHNGFKMVLAGGPFYGDDIQELGAVAASRAFHDGAGTVREEDVGDRYIANFAGGPTPTGMGAIWLPTQARSPATAQSATGTWTSWVRRPSIAQAMATLARMKTASRQAISTRYLRFPGWRYSAFPYATTCGFRNRFEPLPGKARRSFCTRR